jgi:acyl-CoA dehydrogenase
MSLALDTTASTTTRTDWVALIRELGPRFAERSAEHDATDTFVAENYRELKTHGVFAAGVPAELGGGGATHAELCAMVRALAPYCASTALALAMHTHAVAMPAWRWRRDPQPVEKLLRRVAAERLVLVSSGGSDWIYGSASAEKVDGGWRIKGRKIFASGVPGGDLLMTGAIYDDPQAGPTVLHFGLPLKAEGVRILDTWRVMGMRGTGSHDVELDGAFIPEAAIAARRPQGKWHPLYHTITMIAFPIIYAVYCGIAEGARDRVVERARQRKPSADAVAVTGEMENALATARLAVQDMVACAADSQPGPETTNRIMIGRTLVARAAITTVEKAMELAGGAGFYRNAGIECAFRDIQAARYHPLQEKAQHRYAGRIALGLPIDD